MSYMDIMFEKWMNEQPEYVLIKAYLIAGCNVANAEAILWNTFVKSTKSTEDHKGHWEVPVDGCTFYFRPSEKKNAIDYNKMIEDMVRCVFTTKLDLDAQLWIEEHVCTKVEGSNQLVSLKDRAKAYSQALEEFISVMMDDDVPEEGHDYHGAIWVWED